MEIVEQRTQCFLEQEGLSSQDVFDAELVIGNDVWQSKEKQIYLYEKKKWKVFDLDQGLIL